MTCARHLLIDWIRRKNAKGRRPLERAVSFERMKAEDGDPFEPAGGERPEDAFREVWRRSILERAMDTAGQLCTEKGRADDFEVFLEYYGPSAPQAFEVAQAPPDEGPAEAVDEGPGAERRATWEGIAKRRGLDGWRAAARKADWVKRQLARAIRDEVRQYAESDSEVDDEIRELLQ